MGPRRSPLKVARGVGCCHWLVDHFRGQRGGRVLGPVVRWGGSFALGPGCVEGARMDS
jgi:hypothetical protein